MQASSHAASPRCRRPACGPCKWPRYASRRLAGACMHAQCLARGLTLLEVAEGLHQGQVGGGQIGRATDQAGQDAGQRVDHGLAVLAGGQGLVLGSEGGQRLLPALGQLAGGERLELGELLGVLGLVGGAVGLPLLLVLGAAGDGGPAGQAGPALRQETRGRCVAVRASAPNAGQPHCARAKLRHTASITQQPALQSMWSVAAWTTTKAGAC